MQEQVTFDEIIMMFALF